MSGLNLDWSSPLFQRTSSRLAGRIPPTSEVLRFFLYNLKGDLLSFRTCRRVTASCEHPGLQPSATPQQQQPSVSIGQVVYPIRVVLTILFQFSVLAFQFAVQQTAGSSRSLTGTHTEPLQEPASLAKTNAQKKKKKGTNSTFSFVQTKINKLKHVIAASVTKALTGNLHTSVRRAQITTDRATNGIHFSQMKAFITKPNFIFLCQNGTQLFNNKSCYNECFVLVCHSNMCT